MTVYDFRGASASHIVRVEVGAPNQPPVAMASANPTSGAAPLNVAFDSAGSTDPDGTIVSYMWNFGDRVTSTAPNPSHTYSSPGSYSAVLTVTDNWGAAGSDSATVTATGVLRSVAIDLSAKVRRGRLNVSGQVTVQDANSGAAISGAQGGGDMDAGRRYDFG